MFSSKQSNLKQRNNDRQIFLRCKYIVIDKTTIITIDIKEISVKLIQWSRCVIVWSNFVLKPITLSFIFPREIRVYYDDWILRSISKQSTLVISTKTLVRLNVFFRLYNRMIGSKISDYMKFYFAGWSITTLRNCYYIQSSKNRRLPLV